VQGVEPADEEPVHDPAQCAGTASNKELIAAFVPTAFWTRSFGGAAVALDAATGTPV